jgi:hypothetical protein
LSAPSGSHIHSDKPKSHLETSIANKRRPRNARVSISEYYVLENCPNEAQRTTDTFVFSPAAGAAKLFSAVDSEIMSGEREDGAQAREEEV